MKHYLQFTDLTADEYAYLFERAAIIKKKFKSYEKYHPLADRTLAMIFEKASTRTRVSFEAGMYQLGGSVVHLTTGDSQLGRAEPIDDSAKVISRMVDLVMIRTYEQTKIERFAAHSRVPVINGLTNEFHPCQILADIFTFIEHRGSIQGKTVAWVGDGNNMTNSYLYGCAKVGMTFVAATPEDYRPDATVFENACKDAEETGAELSLVTDPQEAVKDADIVVTDTWASMGQEAEHEARKKIFAPYQVNKELLKGADKRVIVMHCLPAYRGEEITEEVLEANANVIFDEAENRLHTQKAIMALTMAD